MKIKKKHAKKKKRAKKIKKIEFSKKTIITTLCMVIGALFISILFFLMTKSPPPETPIHERKINIITTHPLLDDLAFQIGRERLNLIPIQSQSSSKEIKKSLKELNPGSDLVLWLDLKTKQKANTFLKTLDTNQLIFDQTNTEEHHYLVPKSWKKYGKILYKILTKMDPINKESYKENYTLFSYKIHNLEIELKKILNSKKHFFISGRELKSFCDYFKLNAHFIDKKEQEITKSTQTSFSKQRKILLIEYNSISTANHVLLKRSFSPTYKINTLYINLDPLSKKAPEDSYLGYLSLISNRIAFQLKKIH